MRRAACVLVLLLPATGFAAAPAGRVVYAYGDVQAVDAAGAARALRTGDTFATGDLLRTANGRAQALFTDGGMVALQPATEFRVEEYRYDGAEDGSERSFLNLVKGGIRFVTGRIGHRNRDTYRIRTAVATIGIRGSGGRADMCVSGSCPGRADGLYLTGNQDVLTLANDVGGEDVRPGEVFYVACTTCDIARIDTGPHAHVDLDPARDGKEQDAFERGEQRALEGELEAIADAERPVDRPVDPVVPPPPPPPPVDPVVPLASGTGGMSVTALGTGAGFIGGLIGGALTFDAAGRLTQYVDGAIPTNTLAAGTVSSFDADGLVAWGLWTAGTAGGDYATGLGGPGIAALAYVSSLSADAPGAGVLSALSGTYTAFGSTPPVAVTAGAVTATGTADSVVATFNVNFAADTVAYNLSFPLAGETFTMNGVANFVNGGATDSRFLGGGSISSSGAACTPSCTGIVPFGPDLQGYVIGAAGERLGASYGFASNIGKITGALVLKP